MATESTQLSDGAATPINNDTGAVPEQDKLEEPLSVAGENDGPLSKSRTGSSGKAEHHTLPREGNGDLEGNKPAAVQDESKLLHGSEPLCSGSDPACFDFLLTRPCTLL